MKPEWVIRIREQCRAAQVPFFFKQWGGVRKSLAGRELEGRLYDESPTCQPQPILNPGARQILVDLFSQELHRTVS
jgi:hypothetical protein